MRIKWPNGFVPFRKQIEKYADLILTGTLLAIDPSSGGKGQAGQSYPGYALFKAGKLVDNGVVELTHKDCTPKRLHKLHLQLERQFKEVPDILVVEKLRGPMVSPVLHWAVGATVASVPSPLLLEVPIRIWQALCDVSYVKSDKEDARLQGLSVIMLARELRK